MLCQLVKMLRQAVLVGLLCQLSSGIENQIPIPRPAPQPQAPECLNYKLGIIKTYFRTNAVNSSNKTEVQYCKAVNKPRRSRRELFQSINTYDLNEIINLYRSLGYITETGRNPNTRTWRNPITTYGDLRINDREQIPIYRIADIRRNHLPRVNTRPSFGSDVDAQMELMGQYTTDERSHMLAHSLGGTSTAENIVPMARNINRHLALIPENAELEIPRSYWRSNEDWIRRFLLNYPNGRVLWRFAVEYEDHVIIRPQQYRVFRPVSFAMQYTAYTNEYDARSVYYRSPDITFLNDNDFACGYEETHRRRRNIHLQETCSIDDPKQGMGKMGQTMASGSASKHWVAFPYTIQNRTFFYRHSKFGEHQWFIQELLPDGQLGQITDEGSWAKSYVAVFPYQINGRQFFYGSSNEYRNWFIQELLPDGKMGQEMSYGEWRYRYAVSFPYTINGKYYFYGQSILDGNYWFIQELLPNGKMGQETDYGNWAQTYPTVFPYKINGRQFFYGQNDKGEYNWFIQELLPGGKMGRETSYGHWASGYLVSFPYSIHSKTFFYGQSIMDGSHWFIQELLPDGQMGRETSHGILEDKYLVSFPFTMDDTQFFYGYSTLTKAWIIKELL